MAKKIRHIRVPSSIRALMRTLPINMSAAVSQSILDAREDDSLIIRALKRRLALPPNKNDPLERVAISQDERIDSYVADLTDRSQLSAEEIIRLCIEAYLFRL